MEANSMSRDIKEKALPKRKAAIWKALVKAGNACGRSLVFSPLKLVCRARNSYVRTLLHCKHGQETAVELPISFNCNKAGSRREEDNLRRLIKMTEIKLKLQLNAEDATETETEAEAEVEAEAEAGVIMMPPSLEALMRSSSAGGSYGGRHRTTGIAPIDEESPCYFPGSFKKRWATPLPRTASCGATPNTQ